MLVWECLRGNWSLVHAAGHAALCQLSQGGTINLHLLPLLPPHLLGLLLGLQSTDPKSVAHILDVESVVYI